MYSRNILVTGPAITEQTVKIIADNGYSVAYVPPYTNEEDLVRIVAEVDPVGVVVAAGANASSAAEHALTLMLTTVKRIMPLGSNSRADRWEKVGFSDVAVAGLTMGLMGFGAIARHTAVYAKALGIHVRTIAKASA